MTAAARNYTGRGAPTRLHDAVGLRRQQLLAAGLAFNAGELPLDDLLVAVSQYDAAVRELRDAATARARATS